MPGVLALVETLTAALSQCQGHGRLEQLRMVPGGLIPCGRITVKGRDDNCSCFNIRDNWSCRRDWPLLLPKGAGYPWERDRSRAQNRKQLRQPSQRHKVSEVRKTRQLHLPSALCWRNPLAKHMPSPECPSLQQRKNRSTRWKLIPAPAGLERRSSGAWRLQQCGGRVMCRLLQGLLLMPTVPEPLHCPQE